MEDKIIEYAPIIIVVIMFAIQQKVFVTPSQLEKARREIMEDIDQKYATTLTVNELKEQFRDLNDKLDKIYDLLIKQNS